MLSLSCMDVLKTLFQQHFHSPAEHVQPLQGQLGGSGRNIIRLTNGSHSAIGILYPVREENVAFLEFSKHFRRHGLPVPEIYEQALGEGAYLEQDLGDTTLFEFLSKNRAGADIRPEAVDVYRTVVAILPRFQVEGGRKGALQYDIASLLYDAKADLPPELRQRLLDHYLEILSTFIHLKRDVFMHTYHAYVYVRIIQAMGAYGFRGFYERKPHFLQSVPYALKNIRWLLHNTELPIELPTLMDAFKSMIGSEKLQSLASDSGNLVVRIFSFSFHGGSFPLDESGNVGGVGFDCRALPNPGREERFKELTGKDAAVIEYLVQQESSHQFFANVVALVETSVEAYQKR